MIPLIDLHIEHICIPRIQFFDDATLIVRWIGLIIAVMALGKFGPRLLYTIGKLAPWNKKPITPDHLRGAGWAIMCLATMPLSFNFFNRVYDWSLSPWATGLLSVSAPVLSVTGMTMGLIGVTVKEFGPGLNHSLRTLVMVYLGFITLCGMFGIVLIHI